MKIEEGKKKNERGIWGVLINNNVDEE